MDQTALTQPTLTAQLGEAKLIQGPAGEAGVSPVVTVSDIAGGHRLTVTDAGGAQTFDIMDGKDGVDGKDGTDGKDGAQGEPGPAGQNYTLTDVDRARIAALVDGSVAPHYKGVDLTERFADEIAEYSDVWAWLRARIAAGNYDSIHVCDYIPFTTSNSVSLTAQIAGIDTYTGCGENPIGHHIDFICKELWPTRSAFNRVNFNNGVSEDAPYPWLVSNLYHFANSLSGNVPNTSVVGGGGMTLNYATSGIYYHLPAALKAVIIQKHMLLPSRYSASGLLTEDTGSAWMDAGYLWVPSETEVFGMALWEGKGKYGAVQYPLFAHNMNRLKYRNGANAKWWLLSPFTGNALSFSAVDSFGEAGNYPAYSGLPATPVCFRVG